MEKKQVFVMLGVVIAITVGIIAYCLFYGNQYTVIFDSKGGSEVEKQVVKVGKTVEEPETPSREGYDFIEWQFNGKKFDFSTKVKKNMTLIAKWMKVVNPDDIYYIVKFNSNGGSSVDDQSIAAGKTVTKPTNPIKEGYTFDGWYSGKTKYDFSKKITQDIELTAKWKAKSTGNNGNSETTKGDLKVGDKVKIVGEYASSSTSTEALHTRAKGWKRVILKIYDGTEYPYRVGDDTGTTGFFKAESLEKIK